LKKVLEKHVTYNVVVRVLFDYFASKFVFDRLH